LNSDGLIVSVESLDKGHPVGIDCCESLFEKPQKDRSQELPQVETASGQDGVYFIAVFTLQ
jgi:hypothetical protein